MMSTQHPSFLHNLKINSEHEDSALGRADGPVLPVEGCGCAHCFVTRNQTYAIGEPQSLYPAHESWGVDGLKRRGFVGIYDVERGEPKPYVPLVDTVCAYCGDVIMYPEPKHTLPVKVWDQDVDVHVSCLPNIVDELSRMNGAENMRDALRSCFERLRGDEADRVDGPEEKPNEDSDERQRLFEEELKKRRGVPDRSRYDRYLNEVRDKICDGRSDVVDTNELISTIAGIQATLQRHETTLSHLGEPRRIFDALDRKLDRGPWAENVLSTFDEKIDNIQKELDEKADCVDTDIKDMKSRLDVLDNEEIVDVVKNLEYDLKYDLAVMHKHIQKLAGASSKLSRVLGVVLNTLMPGDGSIDIIKDAQGLIEEVEK